MTLILLNPRSSDPGTPGWSEEDVSISVTPWAGSKGAVRLENGTNLILPETDTIQVTGGAYSKPFALEPTGLDWCWKITIEARRIKASITRFVLVPDVAEVAWADLIDVDPNTFDPKIAPRAAWTAALMAFAERLKLVEENGGGDFGVALADHIESDTPHATYDSTPNLTALFESRLAS